MRFASIEAATDGRRPRVPFLLGGRRVGSVAAEHLPALRGAAPWLEMGAGAVSCAAVPDLDDRLAALHRELHRLGHIRAWRDEPYAIVDPASLEVLARIERAASRYWGTLTFGAHATGYVADAAGRPAQLWVAQRAFDKATDPGALDNLIGGGVPFGQNPFDALVREGWEEAGLGAEQVRTARAGSVLRLARDIREGFQHEWIHCWDLELPPGIEPANQDGEVAGFRLVGVAEAEEIAASEAMTVDAAIVTIDFLERHNLLPDRGVRERIQRLRVERQVPAAPGN